VYSLVSVETTNVTMLHYWLHVLFI